MEPVTKKPSVIVFLDGTGAAARPAGVNVDGGGSAGHDDICRGSVWR